MIVCLQSGSLPAIQCGPRDLSLTGNPTLTEVVTAAVYGAPLTPGRLKLNGSLFAELRSLCDETKVLWCDDKGDGPGWMRTQLAKWAHDQSRSVAILEFSTNEAPLTANIEMAFFWLSNWRKKSALGRLVGTGYGGIDVRSASVSTRLAERSAQLAAMSDDQAIAHAISEADTFERIKGAVNATASEFYQILSRALRERRVSLSAVQVDPLTGEWMRRKSGIAPHEIMPPEWFELQLLHDIFLNELADQPANVETTIKRGNSDQINRQSDNQIVKWIDVKVPLEDAQWLLSAFRSDSANLMKTYVTSSSTLMSSVDWNPKWLSLAGAIMWAVTGDKRISRIVEECIDNDRDIVGGVVGRLVLLERQGQPANLRLAVVDAWPSIRRLIADEKIQAEGKCLDRRVRDFSIETRYPNAPIPSGDASDLTLMRGVPGIEPKDALAPDELYRFLNWQGRYWYDVRLRAVDMFREFPAERGPIATREVEQEAKEGKALRRRGRTKGSGSYEAADMPLLKMMKELIDDKKAVSPEAASHLVATGATGAGSVESKAERLAKRYRAKQKTDRNKSD